jgi:hypothetical protein
MASMCEPIAEQGSGLRRSSSFPRSHALLRTLTLGEVLAGRAPLDTEQDLAQSAGISLPLAGSGALQDTAAAGSGKGGRKGGGGAEPSSRSICRPM